MRALLLASLLAVLGLGCDDRSDPPDGSVAGDASAGADGGLDTDGGASGEPCTAFARGEEAGRLASPDLNELSGLAVSRLRDDVLYANNDSGDSARVFLLGTDGAHLGTITLAGATHRDYEDIAVGPGPGGASFVYVGDTGDNNARTGAGATRSEIVLYIFEEPTVDPGAAPLALTATPEAITLTYPGAVHDCESLAVDPGTGDVYLLSKEDAGPSTLFVTRAPLASGVLVELGTVTLAPGSINATAMDLSPNGTGLLVRTYNRVHLFVRGPSEDWAAAIARPSTLLAERPEGQGEAIAWYPDGRGYYTASEGAAPPLYTFGATDPTCAPL